MPSAPRSGEWKGCDVWLRAEPEEPDPATVDSRPALLDRAFGLLQCELGLDAEHASKTRLEVFVPTKSFAPSSPPETHLDHESLSFGVEGFEVT